jgi:hypothetical protein
MIGVKLPGPASRFFGHAAALLLAAMLAGCSGANQEDVTCPSSAIAPDLDAVAIFVPGASPNAAGSAGVQAAGKIFNVSQKCEREKGGIVVNILITINAVRLEPRIQRAEFVYFVAVVDSARNILNEQRFTLGAQFTSQDYRQYGEQISVHLPLEHVSSGDGYAIVVGFQLTPEQLEFNRTHKPS